MDAIHATISSTVPLDTHAFLAVTRDSCEGEGNYTPLRPRPIAVSSVEGDIGTMWSCFLIVVIAVWSHMQVDHTIETENNGNHHQAEAPWFWSTAPSLASLPPCWWLMNVSVSSSMVWSTCLWPHTAITTMRRHLSSTIVRIVWSKSSSCRIHIHLMCTTLIWQSAVIPHTAS